MPSNPCTGDTEAGESVNQLTAEWVRLKSRRTSLKWPVFINAPRCMQLPWVKPIQTCIPCILSCAGPQLQICLDQPSLEWRHSFKLRQEPVYSQPKSLRNESPLRTFNSTPKPEKREEKNQNQKNRPSNPLIKFSVVWSLRKSDLINDHILWIKGKKKKSKCWVKGRGFTAQYLPTKLRTWTQHHLSQTKQTLNWKNKTKNIYKWQRKGESGIS